MDNHAEEIDSVSPSAASTAHAVCPNNGAETVAKTTTTSSPTTVACQHEDNQETRRRICLLEEVPGTPSKTTPTSQRRHSVEPLLGGTDERDDGGNVLRQRQQQPVHASDEDTPQEQDRPSNERLLGTAFMSFMSFAICQMVFSFIAGSEAMIGDSAAMMVDSLTYLFNWIAERQKSRFVEDEGVNSVWSSTKAKRIRERTKRKMILRLELIPPLISVTTLILVTIFVMRKAVGVLYLDMHRNPDLQEKPNINLMLAFSIINLFLDGLNVFCFAKAKHLLGFQTTVQKEEEDDSLNMEKIAEIAKVNSTSPHGGSKKPKLMKKPRMGRGVKRTGDKSSIYRRVDLDGSERDKSDRGEHDDELLQHHKVVSKTERLENGNHNSSEANENQKTEIDAINSRTVLNATTSNGSTHHNNHMEENREELDQEEEEEAANLNMCSAYTHVFADTLRSVAVILAAGIAKLVHGVTPEEADATAAVVVSVLILLSLIPLFRGLFQSFSELRAIHAEEQSETVVFTDPPNTTGIV